MVEQPLLALQTLPEPEHQTVARRMAAVGPESGRQTAWEPVPERQTEQVAEHQKAAVAELVGAPVRQMVEGLVQAH